MLPEFFYIRPYVGDAIPTTTTGWDAIIILGGPMAVYEADRLPFLKQEIDLLKKAIEQDLPMLGICLGSQLIAHAAGAKVYSGPNRELGWGSVRLTEAAANDALFADMPRELPVFQLHGDSFDLPRNAVLLASSNAYHNQAFRLGKCVYGLQFHVEVTEALIRDWVDEYSDYLSGGGVAAADILERLHEHCEALRPAADKVIERFLTLP